MSTLVGVFSSVSSPSSSLCPGRYEALAGGITSPQTKTPRFLLVMRPAVFSAPGGGVLACSGPHLTQFDPAEPTLVVLYDSNRWVKPEQ